MRSNMSVDGYYAAIMGNENTVLDYSDYDRIFYLGEERYEKPALLLFSRNRQEFLQIDIESRQNKVLELVLENECQEAEVYDNRLFCVNGEELTVEVLFSSKKKRMFNKRVFRITKKGIKLRENFQFLIWKQEEARGVYWCLLGPMLDGRYINFELREKWFTPDSSDWYVDRMIFVSLALEKDRSVLPEIVCAMDEENKVLACFNEDSEDFFEYRDFCNRSSRPLNVIFRERMEGGKVRRMYFYYPYNYLTQERKNQLRTFYRGEDESDLRDRYKQIILCVDGVSLLKMRRSEVEKIGKKDTEWWNMESSIIGMPKIPIDVAFDAKTGRIYVMCPSGIQYQEAPEIELQLPVNSDDKIRDRGEKLKNKQSGS